MMDPEKRTRRIEVALVLILCPTLCGLILFCPTQLYMSERIALMAAMLAVLGLFSFFAIVNVPGGE